MEFRVIAATLMLGALSGLSAETPRLVLQITVDQLRGDLPQRFLNNMGEGGFRYLLDQGVVFANAHHAHANTETIVGHATLATGAHPAAHGMVANVWFDRGTGELTYNIEDSRHRLLSAGSDVDSSTEIDPTQRTARSEGRSPAALLVSTFSDELAIHFNGRSKIFGVSVKDRGAVSMAGHAGKAFWFSKKSGEFVTSDYYYDRYPQWVVDWNSRNPTGQYADTSWDLLLEASRYLLADHDDRPWETDLAGFGRTFPHPFGPSDGKYFTTLLTTSPAGDQITLEFALELLEKESLGQDEVPDYLSVSFSSTDYVGHLFGPSSLECEDNLLRLDRTLARLFAHIDETIGLDHTLIALSSDHGGPETPGFLNTHGIGARYIDPESWDKAPGFAALKEQFGLGEELIELYHHPYIYLNREAIAEKGLDQGEVERAVARELMKLDGIALAISSNDLASGNHPDLPLVKSILHNFHPRRSGDVYVVFDPHCFINDFDGLTVAATHGSPWRYDTFVPMMFAGSGLQPQVVHREVRTVDLAPTLAAWLGIKPPSGAAGNPLVELFGN